MNGGTRSQPRCRAQAPDIWTVECQLDDGHDGLHRNNQTVWRDPEPPDVDLDTVHWIDGQVWLSEELSA